MTSPEEENFLRIVYLHYRVVTPVLKRFFDGNHPNLSADLNLATNRAILSNLHNPPPRSRRILFAQQWKTLYPPTGSPPVVSTDLDLTLMVCLLRNISPVVVAPEPSGFDQLPLPSDISDGANIARIKFYTNFLVSHSADGKIVSNDFNNICTELETAITGLGNAQDVADAILAKSITLDNTMKNLLSTQLKLNTKVSYLQEQMEIEQCAKVMIQTQIKSIEEQIIIDELKTRQQIEENKSNTSSRLREMQNKNHQELTRINISIANLEDHQTTLTNFQVVIVDKFDKLYLVVGKNKTDIDNLKGQVESTCNEIKSYTTNFEKRIDLLEEQSGNVEKLIEEAKCYGTKQDIGQLRAEIKELKLNRKNFPDWMIATLQKWKKEDEYFVDTRASKSVMECIDEHMCVSVVGPSGVGKTFLVQHVALEMERKGYTIIKVNSPEEIREHDMSDRPTLFVVDDLCGNFTANTNRLDVWKKLLKNINHILETNHAKLMFTCRLQVFQDEGFKHSDLTLFQTCICNLVEEKLALTESEKESMLLKYLGDADTTKFERLYQYDFFPLLCKMLNTNKDQPNFCLESFLEDPFSSFEIELNDLFVDCKEGKYKFIALLLLVICNNHLDKKVLTVEDVKFKQILEDIREECCINECVKFKSLIKELNTLTGTFVSNEKGIFHAIHDKLFDFLAYYFGTKNEVTNNDLTKLLIIHADKNFICERFLIKDTGQSDDTKRKEYVISVQDDHLTMYIERVFNDMKICDNIKEYLRHNRNSNDRRNTIFATELHNLIKQLKKCEISTLIREASSEFVRAMFVLNETDSTVNDEYEILIDLDLLQEYLNRIFDDMTKSDDVMDYMMRCKSSRNPSFRSSLLSFIACFSSTQIVEIIKKASTSFVQVMFVMTVEDIKQSSIQVYKRYGIEVPDDIMQVYIERVFNEISRSQDVEKHRNSNRNRMNTLFHTKLLAYMEQLEISKMKVLISTASQDFIDRLCVMSVDDIGENSDWEYKRYGIIIHTDCLHMYVDRWVQGMTKSANIENYFRRNRNVNTNLFHKLLQSYMAQLQEHEIEKLIQTAGNDFLHKLFVTSNEDIKLNSSKDYEKVGILVQDKYLQMYNERIWSLIENPETFIRDIRYNRNIDSVRNYTSTLHLSRMIELMHTASVEIFHQMITVDIKRELKIEGKCTDAQSRISDDSDMSGCIMCPDSLINAYMDRMIADWRGGKLNAVIQNNNLINQSFVDKFLKHLDNLEPSKISELVNLTDAGGRPTALTTMCRRGAVNLAKWYIEKLFHGSEEERHHKLCALFLLVVFNNKLEESLLNDEVPKVKKMIHSFERMYINKLIVDTRVEILYLRQPYDIHDGISVKKIKEELDTTFHSIVVTKEDGVYHAPHHKVFNFLAYYIHSFQQLSDVLIEYSDEKDLCERFLLKITSNSEQYFLIEPSEKALHRCIERIFKAMTKSEKLFSYILNKRNNININCINAYIQKLNKEQVKVLIDTACIDFINNVCLIEAEDKKVNINMEMRPHIVIPSDCTTFYTKRVFDNLVDSDCVESFLLDNRNKQNRLFRTTLQTYMTNINRHELETIIKHAGTSEFINRMLVISEEEIKAESYWQYERYGIVVPTDHLHMYIERVLDDLKKSLYLPMNRNTENKTFREEIYRHISSLSKDEIESMIQKGSSKFISRMFMSTNGNFEDIRVRRDECYLMFIPKQYFEKYQKYWSGSDISSHSRSSNSFDCKTTIIKDSSGTFTLFINEDSECEIAMVTVRRENELNIDKLQQHLNKYVDPILTSKRIDCCVKSTSDIVEIYIQRMIADWMQGNVHDVLGNINLNNQTFLCRFLTHLKNFDVVKQAGLVKTIDSNTGDSPLAVCCYVGNIQLVNWCLDNNANTNSCSKYEEYPLQIACLQNYPDILFILLNHKDKADFNTMTGIVVSFYTKPFYEACKKGHTQIVSLLLKEEIDINDCQNDYSKTPLFAACKYGHIDIVSMLLKHKAVNIDVNIGGNFDEEKETTPLFIACKKGHTEIVSLLLNHNVDEVNVKKHTRQWETPLYAACEGGFNDIVDLLMSNKPEIVNKSRMDGATPLFVVCQEGHIEVVSSLLNQKGIEIDKCTVSGMSPLFIASLLGHSKVVQILLRRNADASICVKNRDDVIEVFTKFRNRYRYTSKIPMEFRRFVRYMKNLIIDNASENVKSHVEKKAEDGISNIIFGSSPIHMGSFMGHTDIVKLLVDNMSMEISKKNENGSTPLFLSCEQGHEDIVRILMENGANPTLERKDGKSPLSIAKEIGHTKIVEILNLTTTP